MLPREFVVPVLSTLARPSLGEAVGLASGTYGGPIVDSHVHLFDPTRPQGVPWPLPGDPMYARTMPDTVEKIARPLGVVGAIAVEASPWHADNFWVLDQVRASPFMLGFVGNLSPGTTGFADDLERLGAEDLFLGIRYGNLWERDMGESMKRPAFLADLKRLQQSGRSLDTANPDPQLIVSTLALSQLIPDLRIVIDHLPSAAVPSNDISAFTRNLTELAQNQNVFMKLSEIPQKVDGHYRFDLGFYQAKLDALWDIFGADRIVFGSDFPNSIPVGTPSQIYSLVHSYLAGKSIQAQEKVFFHNSRQLYRWHAREGSYAGPAGSVEVRQDG